MRVCNECNGEGKVEVMNRMKEVTCEECNGTGNYKYWNDMQEEMQIMIDQWNLTKEELDELLTNVNFTI